jgi:hypothetical protein
MPVGSVVLDGGGLTALHAMLVAKPVFASVRVKVYS